MFTSWLYSFYVLCTFIGGIISSLEISPETCHADQDLNFRIISLTCEVTGGEIYTFKGSGTNRHVKTLVLDTLHADSIILINSVGKLQEILIRRGNMHILCKNVVMPAGVKLKVTIQGEVCVSILLLRVCLLYSLIFIF